MAFMSADEENFFPEGPSPATSQGTPRNIPTVTPGGSVDGAERQDAAPSVPPPTIDPTAPNPFAAELALDLTEEVTGEELPAGIAAGPVTPPPVQPKANPRPQPEKPRKSLFKRPSFKAGKSVKVNGSQERVFTDAFVIDSVKIEKKKDVESYIRSKTAALLKSTGRATDDYYFAYVINSKGVLSFISTVTDRHLSGAVSVFAPAFVNEGRYVFQQADTDTPIYHYITNEGGRISCERAYEKRPGYEPLSASVTLDDKIPQTLVFQWSLGRSVRQFNAALTAVLAIFAIVYGVSLNQFQEAKDTAMKNAAQAAKAGFKPMQRGLPNVFGPIWETAAKVGGNGIINHVALSQDGQNLGFTIQFARQVDSTGFISQNGGTVEQNGTVQLNVPVKPRL